MGTAWDYPSCYAERAQCLYISSSKLVPLLSTPCGTTGKDYSYDGCHWITY